MSEISESLRLRLILSFVTLTKAIPKNLTHLSVTHLVRVGICTTRHFKMLALVALSLIASASGQSCGCTADESCCQDDKGYACCIDQIDYCIAPNASVSATGRRVDG